MKRVLISPIFNHPAGEFSGDNVAHYLPGKYLWHVCNRGETGFHQPVDDMHLNEPVGLTYIFHSRQPQSRYFKKPHWIDEFMFADDEPEINRIAKGHDYFVNLYRYRGANPLEMNVGYSSDLKVLNLDLCAYSYKAVYDHDLYIDDLELCEVYREFLRDVDLDMNPDQRPVIVIHKRTEDPHDRHLADYEKLNERLLFDLLDIYRDHVFVLVGDPLSWKYYRNTRIKYLTKYINRGGIFRRFGEYNSALQYILAAYYCSYSDMVFVGISGFTSFIESIRSRNLVPPVPLFWGPHTFTGIDVCIEKSGWFSPEYVKYKRENPGDTPFQNDTLNFMYYSRDEDILRPYCMDYPNSCEKAMHTLKKLESRYGMPHPDRAKGNRCHSYRHPSIYETAVNTVWTARYQADKLVQKHIRKTSNIIKKAIGYKQL